MREFLARHPRIAALAAEVGKFGSVGAIAYVVQVAITNLVWSVTDLSLIASGSPRVAADRAQDRRKIWDKLPYGIPLCVGFLLFLWYRLVLVA